MADFCLPHWSMKQEYLSDACDSLKPSSLLGVFGRSRRKTQGLSSCARFAACSRLMRAASVDEPDIANGAGIRRDGRGTDRSTTCFFGGLSCVAIGRRATTSAQVTFFLRCRLLFGEPCGINGLRARGDLLLQDAPYLGPSGVNCLRARDEGQLQDAPREGLESTVSEPQ